jgi:hypothetical protein
MVKNGAEIAGMNLLEVKRWPDGWGFPLGGSYRKLKDGDIINCEITPSYGGYCARLARPVSSGSPPEAVFRCHRALVRRCV